MWNRIVLVLGTLSLLLAASLLPSAQEQAPAEQDSSYLVVYSLQGLPLEEARGVDTALPRPVPQLRVNALLGGWYWEENPRALDQWSPAVRQLDSVEGLRGVDLETAISWFDTADAPIEVWFVNGVERRIEVESNSTGHKRVSQFLDQLRNWYRQRVHLDVYRLGEPSRSVHVPAKDVPGLLEGAELVGKLQGAPGEFLSVGSTTSKVLLTEMEIWSTTELVFPHPVIRRFPTGWEVSAGVVPLPGGKLWLQGAHVDCELLDQRNVDAFVGEVQAPRIRADYTPASAVIGPGDGVVLGERYLLVASVEGYEEPVAEGSWWIGVPTAQLRPGALQGGAWPGEERVELGFGAWPEEDELELRIEQGTDVFTATAGAVKARSTHHIDAWSFGPVLTLQGQADGDEDERRELHQARAALITVGESYAHRVRIAAVDAEALKGDPEPLELLESAEMLADFECTSRSGQAVDWDRLFAENYLHYGDNTYSYDHQIRDPMMLAAVWGTKVRVSTHRADGKCRLEVLAAHAPGASIALQDIPVGDSATHLEYADIPTAHLKLAGELEVGDSEFTLTQHPTQDSRRLVMVVERVK